MPHKKGRARDVVPHREHRSSKKAEKSPSVSPLMAPTRANLVPLLDLDLPLPAELWLRAMSYLEVVELCRCENATKAFWDILCKENALWQKLCHMNFPAMYSSVCAQPSGCPLLPGQQIDWKILLARRWQKQRQWRRTREEKVEKSEKDFLMHPGDFLPLQPADWSRAELQQLQGYARAACRSVGTSREAIRGARGGGYWAKNLGFKGWGSKNHWAEGLGPRPGPGNLRLCIIGHVPCAWSCCGAQELISECLSRQ